MRTSRANRCVPHEPFLSCRFLRLRGETSSPLHKSILPGGFFFFWARNAIYHGLRAAKLSADDEVLVPAYICKSVPQAILAYGAKVKYFPVDREGKPLLAELHVGPKTRAMVVVHYFGFPQPVSLLAEFCQKMHLFLMEDCAHVLQTELNGKLLGSFGDASVFSMRKFLPVFDGGALILNRPVPDFKVEWTSESPLLTLRAAKDIADQMANGFTNPLFWTYRVATQIARKAGNWLLARSTRGSPSISVEKTDVSFEHEMINHPMSHLSKILFLHSNIQEVVSRRRANYQFLLAALKGVDGLRPFRPDLPEGVCPWVFPLYFDTRSDACSALRREGIPAATWSGVRPDDLSVGEFPDADLMYSDLVFLPVHQSLAPSHLEQIVQGVMCARHVNN